jgi:hypothetical protein
MVYCLKGTNAISLKSFRNTYEVYHSQKWRQNITDKKESKIFLIYSEIQNGAVAKSYMRLGFLIYEEMRKYSPHLGRPLVIYDFATAPF